MCSRVPTARACTRIIVSVCVWLFAVYAWCELMCVYVSMVLLCQQLPTAHTLLPALGVAPEGEEQEAGGMAGGVAALQAELLQDLEVCELL